MIFPILYMGFIFILSSIPAGGSGIGGAFFITPTLSNVLHIPLFGFLSFLWMRTFVSGKVRYKKAILYTIIITICYAGLDEFHQFFVPGRFASLGDFALDTIGCIAGLFVYAKKHMKTVNGK